MSKRQGVLFMTGALLLLSSFFSGKGAVNSIAAERSSIEFNRMDDVIVKEEQDNTEKSPMQDSEIVETDNFMDYTKEVSELVKLDKEVSVQNIESVDRYHTKRLIVKTKDDSVSLHKYGAQTIIKGPDDIVIMQFATMDEAKNCMTELNQNHKIQFVEPDLLYAVIGKEYTEKESEGASYEPQSQSVSVKAASPYKSWGVKKMEADKYARYLLSSKKPGVVVAVVDTGVSEHKFLKGRITKTGYDFIDGDKNPSDKDGHGTHVAGTIVDCTPKLNVKIMPVRVIGTSGVGSSATVANGIKYAADKGAKVINLSLGGGHSQYFDDAVNYAIKKGVVVVVSAGNEYENTRYSCPAHISKCITVAAMDSKERKAGFSNYGAAIDVTAPGVDILSSIPGGGYEKGSGTSMAAPHISAVAAMIRMGYPSKTPAQVESVVRNITKDLGAKGWDKYFGNGLPKLSKIINAKTIKLDQTTSLITKNSKLKLSAKVTPGGYVTWSTSNSKIAAVDQSGVVTGKRIGAAVITATTINGKKASCNLKVMSDDMPMVQPTEITLNQSKVTIDAGKTFTLVGTMKPSNATVKEIVWTSSNETVAEVSEFGTVTTYQNGSTVITATTANEISASCKVTVTGEAIQATSITLNQKQIKVLMGETVQLWATVFPATATDKRMVWSSSNDNVQISQNGVIKGIKAGTSTIKISTTNDMYAECQVTIIDPKSIIHPREILLNDESVEIEAGKDFYLVATVLPANATDPTVTFSSSNTLIADVTPYGKITGRMEGSATITVRTSNGKKETCSVTVVKPTILPTGIIMDKSELAIEVGEITSLKATITPVNATDKQITWSNNDSSILYVNSSGGLSAYKEGTAVITAKTSNGFTATCTVTVKPRTVVPTYVSINEWSPEVAVGEKITLSAAVTPKDAANLTLTWESNDQGIAVVDKNGVVTGIKEGKTKITVKTFNGKTANCTLYVRAKKIPVSGISVEPKELQIIKGDRGTLRAVITPENATNKTVSWESSNRDIVYIMNDGTIYAYKTGSATITVKTSNGLTATCIVTVGKIPVPPTGISLDQSTAEIKIGEKLTLKASVKPEEAAGSKVVWESSNKSIAEVSDQGIVTGVGTGKVVITAKTTNGISVSCTVTVAEKSNLIPESGIVLVQKEIQIGVKQAVTLDVVVTPEHASNKQVSWESSDSSIVSVNSNGIVTGHSIGSVVITAKTSNGLSATCIVTVNSTSIVPSAIHLNETMTTMNEGTTTILTATILPENAEDKTITWSSNDSTVAGVDSNGKVTANKSGFAKIYATASNGVSGFCYIVVNNPAIIYPVSVTLDSNEVSLTAGASVKLSATLLPENTTERALTWESKNSDIAVVDGTGLVTAVSEGTVVITVSTSYVTSASCTVTVTKPAQQAIQKRK